MKHPQGQGRPSFCWYYKKFVDPAHDCNRGWDVKYRGIAQTSWDKLRLIYEKPSDIDLFTVGLAQLPHPNIGEGLTGKVFQDLKGM